MKITNIGRSELQYIGSRLKSTLAALEKELGVTFAYEGGNYGVKSQLKIGVTVNDAGNGKSSAQVAFENYAHFIGLKPNWFGVPFNNQGERYKIVGVNPGRPKNVLSVENVMTGKNYICGVGFVKRGLETEEALGRIAA